MLDQLFTVATDGAADGLSASTQATFALAVRFLLAGVLLRAGFTKLRAPHAASKSISDFGIALHSGPAPGFLLGLIEVALAAALLALPRSRMPAIIAALFFALFALLISRALKAGLTFSCGCLSSRSDPIGLAALLRSVLLIFASACAVALPLRVHSTTRDAILAATLATAAVGVWSLAAAFGSSQSDRKQFRDDAIDWQLAAALNPHLIKTKDARP